jgi:hypothetical protein
MEGAMLDMTDAVESGYAVRMPGSWTVMDHVDIADQADTARVAIEGAQRDARRALGTTEPVSYRVAGLYWERRGDFLRCRAEVEALA